MLLGPLKINIACGQFVKIKDDFKDKTVLFCNGQLQ